MSNTPYGSSNVYTDTSGSSLGTSLVQAAYDRYVEFALRAVPLIRDVADKRPVQQAMPGSSVVFSSTTILLRQQLLFLKQLTQMQLVSVTRTRFL